MPDRKSVLTALALLVPAIVVFAPGLGYPFLQLDDVPYVIENPGLRDLSWQGIRFLFLEDTHDPRWFPLSYVSLAVDHALFGWNPVGFHATNLALHLANTLLVWVLARRIAGDEVVAVVTALLFSVHPLQVESVAWIMSRKNVLFLCFFLLSALAYLRFADERGRRNGVAAAALAGSVVLYLLACVSKTTALPLPAVLVAIDFHRDRARRDSLAAFLWRSLPSKLAYVPPALLVAVVAATRESPFRTHYPFTAVEWIEIVGHNVFFYVVKTLAPLRLGVFYPLPAPGEVPAYFALYTLGALALVALAVWSFFWRRTALFLGLAWYLITILPLAAGPWLLSDYPILVADRYYYQSAIGLFLLVGFAAGALWHGRAVPRPVLAAAGGALLVGLCVLSAAQRSTYRSTIAVYEQLLAHHPSDEFYYRAAFEYAKEGRMDEATRALEAAKTAPHRTFFMRFLFYEMQIADLYRQGGDLASAADHVEAGIGWTPNWLEKTHAGTPLAWLYVADLRERAGDAAGAAAARARAAAAEPDPGLLFERTWISVSPEDARRFLERRVAAHPGDGRAWHLLAVLADREGQAELARVYLERARELGYRPPPK